MTATMHLSGVIPPVLTPLGTAGEVDEPALASLTARLVDAGVGGIFVLGTASEGPSLTDGEQRAAVRTVVSAVGGRVPVLAGVLESSTRRVLALVDRVAEDGADAVVVATPYYFDADEAQQLAHFRAVADGSPVPVVLYDVPPRTHNPVDPSTFEACIDHHRVVAIKESAGDLALFDRVLDLKKVRPDLAVFQGIETDAARSLRGGADGLVPALANLVPDLFVSLVSAAGRDDGAELDGLQRRIDLIGGLYDLGPRLACLKQAVAELGFGSGATSHVGWALPDDTKEAIRAHLRRHELI